MVECVFLYTAKRVYFKLYTFRMYSSMKLEHVIAGKAQVKLITWLSFVKGLAASTVPALGN